jgi:hypothetical protein
MPLLPPVDLGRRRCFRIRFELPVRSSCFSADAREPPERDYEPAKFTVFWFRELPENHRHTGFSKLFLPAALDFPLPECQFIG